jgi:hypothetical protein
MLASLQLGRPVEDFITEHHADDRSYRWIARALRDATDGATDVTDKTVAAWHRAALVDAATTDGAA